MEKIIPFIVLSVLGYCSCNIEVNILHTNDIHAHFDPINDSGEIYGGIARRKTMIDELRNRADLSNVILLDAGDQFSGTLWYYYYGGLAAAYFMKKLGYDVMSLGNHEFDNITKLGEFLDNVDFPVLCSNVDVSGNDRLSKVKPYHVLNTTDGTRIGIIGYVTTRVVDLVDPDNFKDIKIKDILESVSAQVSELKNMGVNIIIANGHAGIDMDIQVAKLDGVDVVVGGDSETFMYTGTPPSSNKPEYPYPYVVTKPSGEKALVVTAYVFGKYLGFLKVVFDDSGNVLAGSGNPIYLNESVAEDPAILTEIEYWKVPLDKFKKQIVGHADVRLEGNEPVCRKYECNLGNMLTDALVDHYTNKLGTTTNAWTQASIAIWNSGGIRHTIEKGDIPLGDIFEVMPYGNTIVRVQVTGATLRKVLENSVSIWRPEDPWGGFLQYAGLQVTYDRTKPKGSRVVDVQVRCADCEIPEYKPLNSTERYFILSPKFLTKGGDKYTMLKTEQLSSRNYDNLDSDVVAEYLKRRSPLMHGVEGRIRFVVQKPPTPP